MITKPITLKHRHTMTQLAIQESTDIIDVQTSRESAEDAALTK